MHGKIVQLIDDGIFTIPGIFSRKECISLIQRAESIGFESATVRTANGPQMMTHIRNNDRVVLEDVELANIMWLRISQALPKLDSFYPCGVDKQLRFYRYLPGQYFKRHKDGAVTNHQGQSSKLSYLIYLNEDYQGGSTTFREYRSVNEIREKVEFVVSPSIGTALLFRHERWHEGSPVICGTKYVLRSDVFYRATVCE